MVFSSLMFLFRFLPVSLFLYYISPKKLKNFTLFAVSIVFYSWGEMRYFPIIVLLICINYFSGLALGHFKDNRKMQKIVLAFSVIGSLSMLLVFKYTNFFIANANAIFSLTIDPIKLTLPLGISFYTFQSMSYTIDVFRGDVAVEPSFIDFGAYVVMFPQLIAGPIVKYRDVAAELKILDRVNLPAIEEGIALFIFGLGKKVLIANNIGALWDEIVSVGFHNISTPLAWFGILAYALQIYFDFSGYSLMGIGMGKMLGFEFPDNFDLPYISRSITEFWRRWHMTLGSWFREYVYIPMGGNRLGLKRQILNLFFVWFLTGFWHGANWNFILWGLYYFALITLEKIWLSDVLKKNRVLSHLYTLLAVLIGWVLFAIVDLNAIGVFLSKMFVPQTGVSVLYYLRNYGISVLVGCIMSTRLPIWFYEKIKKNNFVLIPVLSFILVAVIAYLVDSTYNPFIYFIF